MPSFEPSFMFTKRGVQPSFSVRVSTAYPWFCVVMKQRVVPTSLTGWLWPRWPYFSFLTSAPAARASIWLPMQMPQMGLPVCMKAFTWSTSVPHILGSPGPLLMKRPSHSMPLKS